MANLDYYYYVFKESPGRLPHVVGLIVDDLGRVILSTREALSKGDLRRVHLELHKTRSILFNLKEDHLVELIDGLKYVQNVSDIEEQIELLSRELRRVADELNKLAGKDGFSSELK